MEFEIKVYNPCVTGNAIVFSDNDLIEIDQISLKATYSKEAIDLTSMFTDRYSKATGSSQCGNLSFELSTGLNSVGYEYNFLSFNDARTMLIFESNSVEDVGSYEVPFLARLDDYPAV